MTDAPGGTIDGRAALAVAPGAPNDDHAIVERMAAGDPRALGELYDRFSTVAHALAMRIVGDRDEVEDVVEEAFWQLWRQAARFDAAPGGDMTPGLTHDEAQSALGAAALDALSDVEQRAVLDHVATCEVCSADLAALRQTAAALADAAPASTHDVQRDRALRDRLIA